MNKPDRIALKYDVFRSIKKNACINFFMLYN